MKKTFCAEPIKTARLKAGLTQSEVAVIINVDRSMISCYENGKSYPSMSVAIKMSRLYHMTIDELIFGK